MKFHWDYPQIWELFEQFTFASINRGMEHYSSNAIFERIRWHIDIDTKSEVKLNNNFRAYYARLFHVRHPEHDGFFRNRRLTSEDQAAAEVDQQVFINGSAKDEEELLEKLRWI